MTFGPTCDAAHAGDRALRTCSAPTFFALVFALSMPSWLIGSATDLQLMPGSR
jgi:hypothetical protein